MRLFKLLLRSQTAGRPPAPRTLRAHWSTGALLLVGICVGSGCISWFPANFAPPEAAFAPPPITQNNPLMVPSQNSEQVFEVAVDVVDDYFKIERELPVRLQGDVLVEGQIETFPRGGSTLLEPWNRDAVNFYERLEDTLQSIRRRAVVRIIPTEGGFLVDVAVLKELEDVFRPEVGSASRAPNLRNDNSLRRYVDPVGGQQPTLGWIPLGRDTALEQQILAQLQSRFATYTPPRPL